MKQETLDAIRDAMLAEETSPEGIEELARMVDDPDLEAELAGDAPDDDQGPVSPQAQARVAAWIQARISQRLRPPG
jgi:hypothetical protein